VFDLGHAELVLCGWACIHREHLIYLVDNLGIAFGRNTPLLFKPQLEFLFQTSVGLLPRQCSPETVRAPSLTLKEMFFYVE
jgi:hypothetical protein